MPRARSPPPLHRRRPAAFLGRIHIAQFQHIVYAEYLPKLLGSNLISEYDLLPMREGFYEVCEAASARCVARRATHFFAGL